MTQARPPNPPTAGPTLQVAGLAKPRPPVALPHGLFIVGSAEGAHLRLRSPRVGGLHAAVVSDRGSCVLVDLSGGQGVAVNGKPLRRARLHDGDAVEIGPFTLRFASPIVDECISNVPPARLEVGSGGDTGRGVTVGEQPLRIGSHPASDLVLQAEVVAPVHALIATIGGRHVIWRLSADHPITVEARNVRAAALADGARVRVGTVELVYRLVPAATPEPEPEPETEAELEPTTVLGTVAPNTPPAGIRPFKRRRTPVAVPIPDLTAPRSAETEEPFEPEAAADAPSDEATEDAPRAIRSRLKVYALMLVCMAVAAAWVWRAFPPRHVVRGAMTFQAPSSREPLTTQHTALGQIEARLRAPDVLEAAAARFGDPGNATRVPKPAAPAPADSMRLAEIVDMVRRADVGWRPSPADPVRAALEVTVNTNEPAADVARVNALLRALHATLSAAATRPSAGRLRAELLRSEVEDLKLEVALRRRQADQNRREIDALARAEPTAVQAELRQRREAVLRESLNAAIEERVRAQLQLTRLTSGATTSKSEGTAASRPTSEPVPAPATRPATAGPPAADSRAASALSAARQAVDAATRHEAEISEQLREALAESADRDARARRSAALQQRLAAANAEIPLLESRLKLKDSELQNARRTADESGPPAAAPPDDAREVRVDDVRPFWSAVSTAAIAAAFGIAIALTGRSRPTDGAPSVEYP